MRKWFVVLVAALAIFGASTAQAIPDLQIYIKGATYDATTETWVLTGAGGSFELWVIANNVQDVKLAAAVASSETGTISLTPGTTGGYGGFTDGSTPGPLTYNGLSADGAVPTLGDGSSLPTHGIYGAGTKFHEWALGDMTAQDSPIADFITSFPTPTGTMGTINVYTVAVTGYSQVHFDVYDHVVRGANDAYIFGPFSHDGEAGGNGGNGGSVPEPATALLFAGGLLGLAWNRRKN